MREYLVRWEIGVSARDPLDAAQIALEIMRDPASLAVCFDVDGHGVDLTDPPTESDLAEMEPDRYGPMLPCGCYPHLTRTTYMGFTCDTEGQGYCNFECPHEDDDDDDQGGNFYVDARRRIATERARQRP